MIVAGCNACNYPVDVLTDAQAAAWDAIEVGGKKKCNKVHKSITFSL